MTGNYLPWLVLLGIVVATLVFKGYVKLPSFAAPSKPARPETPWWLIGESDSQPKLDGIDSYTLGIAFAKAKRAEAEVEVAREIARQAGDTIKATFTAPFSAPAPAGPTPPASAQ